jgi:CO/xanthine dehydrogenase FAD-binding subunit
MMTIRNYVKAQTPEQAYELNQAKGAHILGGMLWLKMQDINVSTAIDLSGLGLDTIEETDEEFSIGAMVTLRQLEKHEALNAYAQGAFTKAVRDIVGTQFRNMATVGGSLYGRFGFSDVLTVFLAMDTTVELFHGGMIPLEQFAQMPYDRDLLLRVHVKKTPAVVSYLTVRNSRTDFPVLACATSCVAGEYRTVIGARPMKAILLRDAEGLLKNGVDEASAKQFADYVAAHTPTESNSRASAAYRTHLARVLTQRALLEVGGKLHGN